MTSARLLLLSMAAGGLCATHTVMVGAGGLKFSPNSITAAMGDQIVYQFVGDDHNVVEGSFANPCQPSSATAFYSGDVKPGSTPFVVTINSTDPIWYYCATEGHCQAGMVGVINPPSGMTESDFATAAGMTDSSKAPANIQGGVFGLQAASSSMSASMSMSTSMASMSESAMSSSMMMTSMMSSTATEMATSMMTEMSSSSSAAAASYTGGATDHKARGVGIAAGVLGLLAAL